MLQTEHVEGENKGKIMLYALSTCGWCRKTKELLNELGVEYEYIYIDLLEDQDKDTVIDEVKKWNPSRTFPTLVIDDKCIVGFKENEIREAIG